jgi:hypothetical protein
LLLVVTSSITGQLENFRSQVFKDSCKIYYETESDGKVALRRELTGSTSTDALCVVTPFKQTVHTTDRELKASLGRARLGF